MCDSPAKSQFPDQTNRAVQGRQIGVNVSRKDKINFFVNTVSVEGALNFNDKITLGLKFRDQ